MKSKLLLSVALSALLLFAGCATTQGDGGKQFVAKLAVTYATMKVIEKNPAYAERIVVIASSVRAVSEGDTVSTVALLQAYIKAQIRWEVLSPADALMVNLLLDEVGAQLEARIGSGKLTTDKLLVVGEVASWIEQAATASALR